MSRPASRSGHQGPRRRPAGTEERRRSAGWLAGAQLSFPVFRTFCISVLALLTVDWKGAPCISAFIIVGMICSVVSALVQFFAMNGALCALLSALANQDITWLA